MALTISVIIDDAREKVLNRLVAKWNKENPDRQINATQYVKQMLREGFDSYASQLAAVDRANLQETYIKASPTEQAQIDVILDKYR